MVHNHIHLYCLVQQIYFTSRAQTPQSQQFTFATVTENCTPYSGTLKCQIGLARDFFKNPSKPITHKINFGVEKEKFN